ncbi:PEGA domain protein [bacterium BMS3Abin04]|nr:PEGA domain protein [bacterium BMS3Abin04]
MRKLALMNLLILGLVLLISCVDEYLLPEPTIEKNGKIFIDSNPQNAKIFLLGVDTKKVTPDSIAELESGDYEVLLKYDNYKDTTFILSVFSGKTTQKTIELQKIKYSGSISLASEPSDAEIFVSDTSTGKFTPDNLTNLDPGNYFITLKLKNYKDTSYSVILGENEKTAISINLTKDNNFGNLFIDSEPQGASIVLNGELLNIYTPDTLKNLQSGDYNIILSLEGYYDSTFAVHVFKQQTVDKFIRLRQLPPSGNVFVQSDPEGAEILLNGLSTGKITPDTLKFAPVGLNEITLVLKDFADTTLAINVEQDQTIDVSAVLRDTTPPVTVALSYNVNVSNQIFFNVAFNQDIRFEKVEVQKPGGSNFSTLNYNNQLVTAGTPIQIAFPEKITGIWLFNFYGSKVDGRGDGFWVGESIKVE